MVFEGHFVVFFTGRELAFCSSKHFWHSLKKHVVGFQVVFKNQSSFFSETSSWNPINLQDLNRHFLSKCSWGTHFSWGTVLDVLVLMLGFRDRLKIKVHFLRMMDFCVGSFPQK